MSASLSEGHRALVRVSAHLAAAGASADHPALEQALREAARRTRPAEVEEVLLQSYLFLGYPSALNAFRLWRSVSAGGGRAAVPDPVEADWSAWTARGEAVCRSVYGGQYEGLRDNVRALHPDMERWMVTEGYGKVLGRPELDLATRELCIVALLAVARAPAQLYSHLRGALQVGASPGAVESALAIAGDVAGDEARQVADRVWRRVRARGGITAGSP